MMTGQARWKEIMASPISRQEASLMEQRLQSNVMSTAAAIEALENLLIEKGILKDDELMAAVKKLVEQKHEQVEAAGKSPIEVT